LSREEYIERLDEERDILERRLRHLKAELEELRAEGRATE
jgi:prefoldin subunit 5